MGVIPMWPLLLTPASKWFAANAGWLWQAAIWLFFAVLAVLLFLFWVASVKRDAVEKERAEVHARQLEAYRKASEETQKVAEALEQTLANQKTINSQLNERLDDEIRKNGVYRACVLPADGLRLYNAALRGTTAR